MSENIIFVLDFIINSDKFSTDSFIFMKWNGYKGLWVIESRGGYIPCILQIQLNEGRETKAVFQGSLRLRWPSGTFDDAADEIGCSLPFETHPLYVFLSRHTQFSSCSLMSWWVESSVLDEGDIQNVQGRGSSRTGLKTPALGLLHVIIHNLL